MNPSEEDTEKSLEPTPQKLDRAREKGDVAKSTDVGIAASYLGLLVACMALGTWAVVSLGTALQVPIDQADSLAPLFFQGRADTIAWGLIGTVVYSTAPLFLVPLVFVVLAVLAQRAFVFAPSKLRPKISRISPIENAKNKYGRAGLFEFAKSALKLIIFSVVLGVFIAVHLSEIVSILHTESGIASHYMLQLCLEFLFIIFLVAAGIAAIDWGFQSAEHLRKNRMSRKEVLDETKEAEGDPYLRQERKLRGQSIASNQMLSDVPGADVVIVNPTHFAVALTWSRAPGAAPVCVAKGTDEMAAAIRNRAQESGVPIHHDPPTARALHATTPIGEEIDETQFQAVAIAIRFAEDMRRRARGRGP